MSRRQQPVPQVVRRNLWTMREFRRAARLAVGIRGPMPVRVIPGDAPPQIEGAPGHYVTRTGLPVYHPSAYSRKGWSSMVRIPSDRRIEVGAYWVPTESAWVEELRAMGACAPAITWASQFATPEDAIAACEQPYWLRWCWENGAPLAYVTALRERYAELTGRLILD